MRSSCDSNYDNCSIKFGNLSEPDQQNLLGNDIANHSIYFQVEAPQQSCELFQGGINQNSQHNGAHNFHDSHQADTTEDKMYLCVQLTPNIQQLPKKGFIFESREDKLKRYRQKKVKRVWNKKISYVCRQSVAQKRPRVKGRFVTRNITENRIEQPLDIRKTQRQYAEQSSIHLSN